ncbi:efflux RND transporter periplasmic adaptor subunit [Desulfonatronum parangueonense]
MQRGICNIQVGAAVTVFLLLALGLAGCGESPEPGQRQMPPAPVVIMHVQEQNVEVMRDYPARVHGSRQVQVRARVEGILRERHYQEGRMVSQGELLFRIDPERYEIALRRAEADLADAQANLSHARREWNRYSALYAEAAVSELERDRAMTEMERAQARFAQAEVAVADARRNLGYTEVRAPVAGLTDMESLSEGNLIEWGGLLTTITQHDPVHVRFSMPESDATLLNGSGENRGRVNLLLSDGQMHPVSGEIDFTAGTIDARTGTVAIRAVFANPEQHLIPGQFVRVQMALQHLERVFLVPESAIGQGRETTHIFTVDAQDTARARPVRLGPVINGRQVILDGLQSGDRVVISGQVALREGAPVNIIGEEAL